MDFLLLEYGQRLRESSVEIPNSSDLCLNSCLQEKADLEAWCVQYLQKELILYFDINFF
jgi:hypothetical protein